ncbi:kinesin motor domain-containing protein [Pycnococcus provasolii]
MAVVMASHSQSQSAQARGGRWYWSCVSFLNDGKSVTVDRSGNHGNQDNHENYESKQQTTYTFDHVFDPNATQSDVYEAAVRPVVDNVFAGFHATIFAYGQTGSGKTFTMEGRGPMDQPGAIPRAVADVFRRIQADVKANEASYTVTVSYVEIYMERVRDLLDKSKGNLEIRYDINRGIFVEDATEAAAATEQDVLDLLDRGSRSRHTGATGMNEESSRSHAIFMLTIQRTGLNDDDRTKRVGKLYLVDLAGSEVVSKTGAEGERLEEAKTINKSLSALGKVIYALTDARTKNLHIPYRESKLTRFLQDSLGGSSKTVIIIACSPSTWNIAETLSTIRFGSRAQHVRNQPRLRVGYTGGNVDEILAAKEVECAALRAKIAELQENYATYARPAAPGSAITLGELGVVLDRLTQLESSASVPVTDALARRKEAGNVDAYAELREETSCMSSIKEHVEAKAKDESGTGSLRGAVETAAASIMHKARLSASDGASKTANMKLKSATASLGSGVELYRMREALEAEQRARKVAEAISTVPAREVAEARVAVQAANDRADVLSGKLARAEAELANQAERHRAELERERRALEEARLAALAEAEAARDAALVEAEAIRAESEKAARTAVKKKTASKLKSAKEQARKAKEEAAGSVGKLEDALDSMRADIEEARADGKAKEMRSRSLASALAKEQAMRASDEAQRVAAQEEWSALQARLEAQLAASVEESTSMATEVMRLTQQTSKLAKMVDGERRRADEALNVADLAEAALLSAERRVGIAEQRAGAARELTASVYDALSQEEATQRKARANALAAEKRRELAAAESAQREAEAQLAEARAEAAKAWKAAGDAIAAQRETEKEFQKLRVESVEKDGAWRIERADFVKKLAELDGGEDGNQDKSVVVEDGGGDLRDALERANASLALAEADRAKLRRALDASEQKMNHASGGGAPSTCCLLPFGGGGGASSTSSTIMVVDCSAVGEDQDVQEQVRKGSSEQKVDVPKSHAEVIAAPPPSPPKVLPELKPKGMTIKVPDAQEEAAADPPPPGVLMDSPPVPSRASTTSLPTSMRAPATQFMDNDGSSSPIRNLMERRLTSSNGSDGSLSRSDSGTPKFDALPPRTAASFFGSSSNGGNGGGGGGGGALHRASTLPPFSSSYSGSLNGGGAAVATPPVFAGVGGKLFSAGTATKKHGFV